MNPVTRINDDRNSARSISDSNADICFLALSADGVPSVRTLVLREVSNDGLVLFINQTSPKWTAISSNDRAEVLLWYPTLQRQYRVSGRVEPLPRASIEMNWPRRPAGSKYLDHAYGEFSSQSQPIASREALVTHISEFRATNPEDTLSTPASAMGIRLVPITIECLDLNSQDRIHDRRLYTLEGDAWVSTTLMP